MPERPLHVVVSTTRRDAGTQAIAVAVAEVFDRARHASSPPIALPTTEAHSTPLAQDVEGADVLVALDAAALEDARGANVGMRVALWPGLGDAWLGSVESADLVLVPHASQVALALARGAARSSVEVVGPLRPAGFSARGDRFAQRRALGIPEGSRVLVVPTSALPTSDLSGTFTQLALVKEPLFVLFDVEDDVEAAKQIRALAPRFGLAAGMFSERTVATDAYAVADRVLVRLEGPETLAALASGAPLFVIGPKSREADAARALAAAHLAAIASSPAMIAVELDAAMHDEALDAARAAVVALDATGAGERIATAVATARTRLRPRATGLPRGLEMLPRDPGDAASKAIAPWARATVERKKAEDDAVERELAELKKRIGG
jgi:hypothetical protein